MYEFNYFIQIAYINSLFENIVIYWNAPVMWHCYDSTSNPFYIMGYFAAECK